MRSRYSPRRAHLGGRETARARPRPRCTSARSTPRSAIVTKNANGSSSAETRSEGRQVDDGCPGGAAGRGTRRSPSASPCRRTASGSGSARRPRCRAVLANCSSTSAASPRSRASSASEPPCSHSKPVDVGAAERASTPLRVSVDCVDGLAVDLDLVEVLRRRSTRRRRRTLRDRVLRVGRQRLEALAR